MKDLYADVESYYVGVEDFNADVIAFNKEVLPFNRAVHRKRTPQIKLSGDRKHPFERRGQMHGIKSSCGETVIFAAFVYYS